MKTQKLEAKIITEIKPDHFYAKRNKKGQLVQVEDPKVGSSYIELPVVAGG